MLYHNGDEDECAENKRNGKGSIDIDHRYGMLCKE